MYPLVNYHIHTYKDLIQNRRFKVEVICSTGRYYGVIVQRQWGDFTSVICKNMYERSVQAQLANTLSCLSYSISISFWVVPSSKQRYHSGSLCFLDIAKFIFEDITYHIYAKAYTHTVHAAWYTQKLACLHSHRFTSTKIINTCALISDFILFHIAFNIIQQEHLNVNITTYSSIFVIVTDSLIYLCSIVKVSHNKKKLQKLQQPTQSHDIL